MKLIHCLSGHGIRPASYYDDHPCINHPPDKNPMAIKPTRPFLQLKSKLNPRNTALPTRATVRNISAYSQLVSVSKSPDAFPDNRGKPPAGGIMVVMMPFKVLVVRQID